SGYRAAKEFMKLLMPSHARRVKQYADPVPLFQRYGAEDQLSAMYDPVVQLKSGGYLVINPTEALVSIDINSGRSTKEHGIEATALNTNLEAAREIARQLRLRDMAGLVVIDFIDMEYGSNIRKVEKAMKDALKNDRARIQVGRISGFGLMEMSRQRLRTGVLEATTRSCPHCDGTGLVRTASSAGLSALRLIEDEAAKGKGTTITLYASTEAAVYLLNAKRADLAEIEERYGVTVEVLPEGEDEGAKMRVTSTGPRPTTTPKFAPLAEDDDDLLPEEDDAFDDDDEFEAGEERTDGADRDSQDRGKRRRRRRGGRGRTRDERDERGERDERDERDDEPGEDDGDEREGAPRAEDGPDSGERPKKRRRRGGRRRRRHAEGADTAGFEGSEAGEAIAEEVAEELMADAEPAEETVDEAPAPKPRGRRKKAEPVAEPVVEPVAEAVEDADREPEPAPKPRSRRKKAADAEPVEVAAPTAGDAEPEVAKPKRSRRKKADEPADAEAAVEPVAANDANGAGEPEAESDADDGPRRSGWWQRTFGN
ncbi:MAG TPA: ribonuclease E/G, partial [Croceibacterium sp.]|nr:ribonuclease E/G [Croceibacterium sp.]